MLLGLAAVMRIVDAVSFLALGRVFTANITGNISHFAVRGGACVEPFRGAIPDAARGVSGPSRLRAGTTVEE